MPRVVPELRVFVRLWYIICNLWVWVALAAPAMIMLVEVEHKSILTVEVIPRPSA